MLNIILLTILCAVCVEIFLRTKVLQQVVVITGTAKKAVSVMSSSKISDHWKENVLPRYSLKILRASFIMLAVFVAMIALFLGVSQWVSGFLSFTLSAMGIVLAIVLSVAYVKLRSTLFVASY